MLPHQVHFSWIFGLTSIHQITSFQDSIKGFIQKDNKRLIKPCTKDVYLIYNAKETAVLIECGFLSNPEECARLRDPVYLGELSTVIFTAILSRTRSQ